VGGITSTTIEDGITPVCIANTNGISWVDYTDGTIRCWCAIPSVSDIFLVSTRRNTRPNVHSSVCH
jgi:hypothetical protein